MHFASKRDCVVQVLLVKLRAFAPATQLVCISATMGGLEPVLSWLDVQSSPLVLFLLCHAFVQRCQSCALHEPRQGRISQCLSVWACLTERLANLLYEV